MEQSLTDFSEEEYNDTEKDKEEGAIVELEVRVQRVLSYKEDTGWCSFASVPEKYEDYGRVNFNQYGNMSCAGVVQKLELNQVYKMRAEVMYDKKWGKQYRVIYMKQDIPTSPEGIRNYIKQLVTPLQFENIYKVYSEDTNIIELVRNDQFDWQSVHGFGEFMYSIFKEKIIQNIGMLEFINEFPMLEPRMIIRVIKHFQENTDLAIQKLRENPYILTDIAGVGFITADKIAIQIGIEQESSFRIHSCIRYVIREVEQSGDVYITPTKLLSNARDLLNIKKALIEDELSKVKDIVCINGKYAMKYTFELEVKVAKRLVELNMNCQELDFDVEAFISKMEDKYKIKLTDQQKQLFYNVKRYGVNFLIGYAGTGKSMLQKLIIELCELLGLSYRLLAPTGKASKVLGKYTNKQASTIHKAVGIGSSEIDEGRNDILEDLIIVDESSMCDIRLVHSLLNSIRGKKSRILFIGDSFQIPSVSAGNFLFDCQESEMFATTILDVVFRQKEGGILDVATKVRKGEKFISDNFIGEKLFGKNCLFISCAQDEVEGNYINYYNRMIKTYGVDGVMVLSPTKKGNLGTYKINNVLQQEVNPKNDFTDDNEIMITKDKNEIAFRVGDMIINNVNTYHVINIDDDETEIMNGDTGVITEVNATNNTITIEFESDTVIYKRAELEKLLLSYALTMHKSQGSSSKAVIAISDKAHTRQLNANLLYVAWTRPEEFLVIIGSAKTINFAMKQFENLRRNTFLCDILKGNIEYKLEEKGAA